jgi:cell volume regulation protein A
MLLGSVALLSSVLATKLGDKGGLPSLLIFLGIGMIVGFAGLDFEDASLAHSLGFAALVFILAEGGLTTRWEEIKRAAPMAVLLASVGVLASVALVAVFAHYALGLDLVTSILLGAVVSPTDSAAVFSVLRKVALPSRVKTILEGESGFNDAPIVLLVAAASAWSIAKGPESGWLLVGVAGEIVVEIVGGVIVGVLVGWGAVWVMKHIALPMAGLYPLGALGWAVFAYAFGSSIHVSGFAAVYVAAVLIGNGQHPFTDPPLTAIFDYWRHGRKSGQRPQPGLPDGQTVTVLGREHLRRVYVKNNQLPHRYATRSFAEGIGWIAQIGLFVMLGVLAANKDITLGGAASGVIVGLFLTFVARPLSVWLCTVWFRLPLREMAFVSWAGLRGAVPIVMTLVPLADGSPHADEIFDLVFCFVIVFTVIQAPSLPWVARKLGIAKDESVDLEFEFAPLDTIAADMMQVSVEAGSRIHGIAIREVRLPKNSVISLIVRDGKPFTPKPDTQIFVGDDLLVVTNIKDRERVENRFKALSKHGRLARWQEMS